MSSLGISILILAVSAIVAVVAVNLAQALGRRRRLAAARPRGEADKARERGGEAAGEALAPADERGASPRSARADRREPRLGDVEAPAGAEPGFASERDPDLDAPHEPPEAVGQPGPARSAPAPARPPAPAPLLSPMCDGSVPLPRGTRIPGERCIAAPRAIRRAGGKPILVDGLPAGFASEDDAVPLAAGISFRALRMGVLLANRHGPLNAMEYSEFVAAAQAVADQLATLADTPDMADAIARARDLDATCAQLDAQIGLNVDSPEALGPAQVAALAAELGMVDRGGHRHARLGPGGELVFTMSLTDSPQRLGFLLDVPRTAESLEGWSAMLDCARDVAARLSGRVVDDAGRPIPLESLDTIARQLAQRYASLEAIGLPAGSPLAMRVFN